MEQEALVSLDFIVHLKKIFFGITSYVTESTPNLYKSVYEKCKGEKPNYILLPIHYIIFHCFEQKNPSILYNSDNSASRISYLFVSSECQIGQ